jgi:hypothetical protein
MMTTTLNEVLAHLQGGTYSQTTNFQKTYIPVVDEHKVDADVECYLYAQNVAMENSARCAWTRRYVAQLALVSWVDPANSNTGAERHLTAIEEVLDRLESYEGSSTLTSIALEEVYNPEDVHSRAVFTSYVELEFIA